MTLIVAAASQTIATIASDRRFTSEGKIVDDEATKATVITCADARCALAFTGLAAAGQYSTQNLILESLHECGNDGIGIDQILKDFGNLVSKRVSNLKSVPKTSRKILMIICGFRYAEQGKSNPFIFRLSNEDDGEKLVEKFHLSECTERAEGVLVEVGGYTPPVPQEHLAKFLGLVAKSAPVGAIKAKAYDLIRRSAENSQSQKLIGKQCNCTVIHASWNRNIESTYFSAIASNVVYGAASAIFTSGTPMMVHGSQLTVGSQMPPAVVPKVRPNSPCLCGSGEKYKRCHARLGYPYLPLRAEVTLTDGSRMASGSRFVIESRGAAAIS